MYFYMEKLYGIDGAMIELVITREGRITSAGSGYLCYLNSRSQRNDTKGASHRTIREGYTRMPRVL